MIASTQPLERTAWGRRGTAGVTIAARLGFEAVTHHYGSEVSLRGIDLVVEPGEVVCLLGRSGCGKTTLLRVTAGLEMPSGGRVTVNGREIAGPKAHVPPEKRGIGLMFQDYALFPHMTILKNVVYGLADMPRAEAERQGHLALARVGLEGFAAAYPHELSGGEQQRVHLARVLCQVPEPAPGGVARYLFLDEPTASLDLRHQLMTLDIARAFARAGGAVAAVLHDLNLAALYADHLLVVHRGRIAAEGPPAEVLTDAMIAAVFGVRLKVGAAPEGLPFVLPHAASAA